MGVIQDTVKQVFISSIPFLSFGIVIVMLEFFFDYMFMFVDSIVGKPISRFMQRNFRRTSRALPHFNSFLSFLLTLLLIVPFLTALMEDVFTPFLRSLSNNFFITLISPIILLIVVYLSFEAWFKRRFKRF